MGYREGTPSYSFMYQLIIYGLRNGNVRTAIINCDICELLIIIYISHTNSWKSVQSGRSRTEEDEATTPATTDRQLPRIAVVQVTGSRLRYMVSSIQSHPSDDDDNDDDDSFSPYLNNMSTNGIV